ncbi:cobalt-precorrin-5B (C(1))-methyltransferase CbiD [Nodosilinea sp. PGN35]|uniref:cobalt-precorrin-5B (C(1))-methyltransferase CbiD n=1 Tax=Nodosilinea sp. PGN35 TaxID=3020489 RepID=UPI0023B274F6|nr:cobalt-precorrin-5B (C(1))-methyltransferase CbiD [Nodosilinea sp. TSF1-S3]MDF0368279.1 cobalt-precorrin-5B (C(1))-methyltransferase CbiD [Nodosilinea sp. TSF1-S3]
MTSAPTPRAGYTLPVFACAGAMAALRYLLNPGDRPQTIPLDLLNPPQPAAIPIAQLAPLPDGSVLAITHSDPGDNLDLTRRTPLWSVVAWGNEAQPEVIQLEGGEGIGKQLERGGAPAIYSYAKVLIAHHLTPLIPSGKTLRVTIILPEGRALAERTSNAAFGVVDGLSLLGTAGISQPLSAPGQLEQSREILRAKAAEHTHLVFCLGENGLDLATQIGIDPERRVKTANWLGPMLVEAGQVGVAGVLLLGYHGKLIKLAGGIFHTHHHVADGRQEILAACCAAAAVPLPTIQAILQAATVEAGLGLLRAQDEHLAQRVYQHMVERIDERAAAYVYAHTGYSLAVGTMVFDRLRQVVARSDRAQALFEQVLVD